MPQKKRQAGRRSEPKLFRCTGFGNCDMVFTRSEHLARHARKHTGEKPFRCVVPNCDRMFSRFDNMMQHTHTHNRTKKKDSSDSSDGKASPMSVPEDNTMMHVPPMPTSPRSYAEHQKLYMVDNHRILPGPRPNEKQPQPMYHSMYYQPPATEEEYIKYQQQYFSVYPVPPYMHQGQRVYDPNGQQWAPVYYSPTTPPQFHHPTMMVPPPHPLPPPSNTAEQQYHQPQQSNTNSVSPTADYYSNNNNNNSSNDRKNSIHSETTVQHHHKRRLSYVELSTPIQELGSNYYSYSSNNSMKEDDSTVSTEDDDDDDDDDERQMSPISMDTDCTTHNKTNSTRFKSDGIDITADEYEALQGFGKFCTEPVVREPMLMTRITTSPTCSVSFPIKLPPLRHNISPTAVLSNTTSLPSQVHAFRQQILTVQESFQRGTI